MGKIIFHSLPFYTISSKVAEVTIVVEVLVEVVVMHSGLVPV